MPNSNVPAEVEALSRWAAEYRPIELAYRCKFEVQSFFGAINRFQNASVIASKA
jgi:hypothetical protein